MEKSRQQLAADAGSRTALKGRLMFQKESIHEEAGATPETKLCFLLVSFGPSYQLVHQLLLLLSTAAGDNRLISPDDVQDTLCPFTCSQAVLFFVKGNPGFNILWNQPWGVSLGEGNSRFCFVSNYFFVLLLFIPLINR